MVAMLGAAVVIPMTATKAFATSGAASWSMATDAGAMPCHKPVNPCPHCPQKACPDMGGCLAKCLQLLTLPAAAAVSRVPLASSRVLGVRSPAPSGSLIPPLLRPPIV